jgi:poly-gamma-glutamate synthase PgsB/CapB
MVLVTNFRVDHTDAVGDSREEVAAVLALDVPGGARVFAPEGECPPVFRELVGEGGADVTEVPNGLAGTIVDEGVASSWAGFSENLALVVAMARSLGVDDETIRRGVREAMQDVGAVRLWRYRADESAISAFLVSAFAANDPVSTMLVYDRVMGFVGTGPDRCVGLMSLRADRGDRSLQWAEALAGGLLNRFSRLYIMGLHAPALRRRVMRGVGSGDPPPIEVLRPASASRVTERATWEIRDTGGVVFGFGNIGGMGEELVEYWSGVGEAVGHGI